jgi:hypothetical protein
MIKVWVESGDESFAGGEYVFATLPPIGARILVRGKDGAKRNMCVQSIELYGIREEDWPAAEKIGGYPDVILYCAKV